MIKSLKDDDTLLETLADHRINAICIGPGAGVSPKTQHLVKTILDAKRATVLDADALPPPKAPPIQKSMPRGRPPNGPVAWCCSKAPIR